MDEKVRRWGRPHHLLGTTESWPRTNQVLNLEDARRKAQAQTTPAKIVPALTTWTFCHIRAVAVDFRTVPYRIGFTEHMD